MPESIRPGKVRVRGARSGRKVQARRAGKETEGDNTQNKDSCEEGEVVDIHELADLGACWVGETARRLE